MMVKVETTMMTEMVTMTAVMGVVALSLTAASQPTHPPALVPLASAQPAHASASPPQPTSQQPLLRLPYAPLPSDFISSSFPRAPLTITVINRHRVHHIHPQLHRNVHHVHLNHNNHHLPHRHRNRHRALPHPRLRRQCRRAIPNGPTTNSPTQPALLLHLTRRLQRRDLHHQQRQQRLNLRRTRNHNLRLWSILRDLPAELLWRARKIQA